MHLRQWVFDTLSKRVSNLDINVIQNIRIHLQNFYEFTRSLELIKVSSVSSVYIDNVDLQYLLMLEMCEK